MKSPVDVHMHAVAFLYDHLGEFPVWIRRLTPGQLEHIARIMLAWLGTKRESQEIVPLEEVEKREIIRAISLCGGDILKAAEALRVGKSTLYRKVSAWGYSIENRVLIHQASILAEVPSGKPELHRHNLIAGFKNG
jgi:hypothetical protein